MGDYVRRTFLTPFDRDERIWWFVRNAASMAGEEAALMRTLIVDDEPDMRMLMRAMLSVEDGFEVTHEACDGEEALATWVAAAPDVIVLDMRMPGLSGLEVARRILATDPEQAVVMCSAYMDPADIDEAQRIGVAACVDKMDMMRLPNLVTSALGTA